MKKTISLLFLLALVLCACGGTTVSTPTALATETEPQSVSNTAASELVSTPTLSPQEQNIAEIYRLVEEYDRVIQEELKTSDMEKKVDPQSGETIFLFTGDSLQRALNLYWELSDRIQLLNEQYKDLYIAEVNPTPFPVQPSEDENDQYYQNLVEQYPIFFDELFEEGPKVRIYDPSDGMYHDMIIGEASAKSEIMLEALETLREAPLVAAVDQEAQIAAIRSALGSPELALAFFGVSSLADAPWVDTAIYLDEQGTRYSVGIDTNTLVAIDTASGRQAVASQDVDIQSVRPIAEEFALNQSPRFGEMNESLTYEEGKKGDVFFFQWSLQDMDWSGTPWEKMPPSLLIGLSADGEIVTYSNTLDQFE
jgi:hypothetical protein